MRLDHFETLSYKLTLFLPPLDTDHELPTNEIAFDDHVGRSSR